LLLHRYTKIKLVFFKVVYYVYCNTFPSCIINEYYDLDMLIYMYIIVRIGQFGECNSILFFLVDVGGKETRLIPLFEDINSCEK